LSTDEKYFFITTSDHNTSEQYYFAASEEKPNPKLIKKRKKGIIYSVNSWKNFFYNHTNEEAEDFKIERCKDLDNQEWKNYISAKDEVLIGGIIFLNDWEIRSEVSDALSKIFIKNVSSNKEEQLDFVNEKVIVPSVSNVQKDRDTDLIYLSYSSPKTQARTYLYNLRNKEKS
jgi:Protease II